MTRKEEIEKASKNRADQYSHPIEWNECYRHFKEGAEWADQNPDKKHVYTKQQLRGMGFAFTLNGDIVTPKEMRKDLHLLVKHEKGQLIEKAVKLIKENIDHYIGHYLNDDDTYLDDGFLEVFRKAMEE